ncbi:MAG: rod shape-determining protein MreD [Ruminococcaceae bacterium]|nr:rod shape-determining protein MreD [Oscillospiraceae bacterium]
MRYDVQPKSTIAKQILAVVVILLIALLQTTVIRGLEVFHVVPNLLFITVVIVGLLRGDYCGLSVGVLCGFLLDIMGGRAVGSNTLLCTYVAYLCTRISGSLFNRNVFVSMVFVLLFSVPYELFIYIFNFVIWGKGAWGYALFCKILPAVIYNFLFTIVLYPVVRRLAE